MKVLAIITTLAACAMTAVAQRGRRCNYNGNPNGRLTCCSEEIPVVGKIVCLTPLTARTCRSDQKAYCCNAGVLGRLITGTAANCNPL
ncbi:unnamed protein product [Fusarium equiseti]|uniref:Hydrophobin 3 n=1 Tax=Fusarium equiseti TaxID=61235 RepID=A0A8J2IVX1_FUSEQ|nr:unnamed protein product [Fusarium equiseti]